MEKSTSAKTTYLLEAAVEVLHQQSIEWLSDIAFWKDEVAFLYSLIVRKTIKEIPISAKDTLAKIEGDLIRITGGELDDLKLEVEMHEYFLNQVLKSKNKDEGSYRERHKQLTLTVEAFEKKFKKLKQEIFKLVELINKKVVLK